MIRASLEYPKRYISTGIKLTDKHVSDKWISESIKYYAEYGDCYDEDVVNALLELKQRRAEDRAKSEVADGAD